MEINETSPDIPCTACRYCTEGCPKKIAIPDVFAIRNRQLTTGRLDAAKEEYAALTAESGKASDCILCGQCEKVCPQKLEITKLLKDCAQTLE